MGEGGAVVGVAREGIGGDRGGGGVSCVGVTGSKLESERKEAAHVLGLLLYPKLPLCLPVTTLVSIIYIIVYQLIGCLKVEKSLF